MKKLVIGILAHVDSGKTTLSEALLYTSGTIRKLGRVDHKNAFLDTDNIERERGITIFSKQAQLKWKENEFTLLDTPGHVDFSTETERTLQVLDYAVLVISGAEGVQSHTETLWRLLKRYNVPTFIFVNKTDLMKSTKFDIMCQLRKKLSEGCFELSELKSDENAEDVALRDETLMNMFLENGGFSQDALAAAVSARRIFPCCFGSALKLNGVEALLDAVNDLSAAPRKKQDFGARVFKIERDQSGARLTYMKITGGTLHVKDELCGERNGAQWCEKVNRIRVYSGEKFKAEDSAAQGTVCAVEGLSETYPGEGLGAEGSGRLPLLEPVLTYSVILPPGTDNTKALAVMRIIGEEDPQLHVSWDGGTQEIRVQLMGEIQLEVVKRILHDRFNLTAEFRRGRIAYKETVASSAEGVGHFEPLRHYAEVHLLIEPGERGSGVVLAADCSEEMLALNWQRLVLTHLAEKSHIGVLTGSPLTDVKIILVGGRAHKKHTEGGDFRQATYRAVRQGLKQVRSVLLEPWYEFTLSVPQESIGRALNDLQRFNARFSAPQQEGEAAVITGKAPVSSLWDYQSEVLGYTRGRGRLSCIMCGYDECMNPDEVIAEIGYDSDADTDNPADSVFCAGGAGFNVRWDEVSRYMHVESRFSFGGGEQEEKTERARRVSEYVGSIEQDKELLAIFEKTYGKIKRHEHSAMHTVKEAPKPYKGKPLPGGERYLLVDGYNIIFAWDELKKLAEMELELARERLVTYLCSYAAVRKIRVILVFDAYKVKGGYGAVERVHNIDVVYTKEAETADMYIEKVTHELSRNHRVRVATSDGLEQLIILGGGAVRTTADELWAEVNETEKSIREFMEK